MGTTKKKDSKKSSGRGNGQKQTAPSGTTKKPAEFKSSLLSIATEVNSVGNEFSWELRNELSRKDSPKASEPDTMEAPVMSKSDKEATDKPEKKRATKSSTKKGLAKGASKDSTPSSPAGSENKVNGLWEAAKAKRQKKPKESQVWIDSELYREIEMLNLKNGKPVPTKHLVNAILKMFLDANNAELAKTKKDK